MNVNGLEQIIKPNEEKRQDDKMECLGCRIVKLLEPEVNVIYEDEHVVCVLDLAPYNEGHILILPRKHYHDLEEIDEISLAAIMKASVTLSKLLKTIYKPDGITIAQNGGIFNDLTHYHMHVIPRFKGDGFTWSEPVIEHNAEKRLKQTRNMIIEYLNVSPQGSNII
jgi:histidine triad (HIT) family protein